MLAVILAAVLAGVTEVDAFPWVEVAIAFAALAYVTQIVLDATGKSRTSRTLRTENEDLVRRNRELELDAKQNRRDIERLESEVSSLRSQVDDLSKRDQAAVLAAIELHERNATQRGHEFLSVMSEIRDTLRSSTTTTSITTSTT